jgi:peptidoglycan hydrolase-like protein with peptidoglycan-binding domain
MLRAIVSRCIPALLVGLAALLRPAAGLWAQDVAGAGVEIISGNESALAGAPGASGVRVMSFVGPDGNGAAYRVVEPLRPAEVLAIQKALAAAGQDPGGLDGVAGPATRAALRRFQTASGATACGCVDYATVVALGLRPLVVQTVIGKPADEPRVEMIVPPARLAPPALAPPPPETVYVASQSPPEPGAWVYPAFPVGVPVIVGPGRRPPAASPRGGVPFGGRGPIRLGSPGVPSRRPPPDR